MRPNLKTKRRLQKLGGCKRRAHWSKLPYTALVEIYRKLPDVDRVAISQVCHSWGKGFRNPTLWRSRHFEIGGPKVKASGQKNIQYLQNFGKFLRQVRITCRHITSNTCESITSSLESFAKYLQEANLQTLEIVGIELDRFWKHAHLRGKVADCLVQLLRTQHHLEVFEISSSQFGLLPGVGILEKLVTASGNQVHTLILQDFFHSQLAVFQLKQFQMTMERFTYLQLVALNYCCLSDELLLHWARSLQGKLKSLRIKACEHEPHAHVIKNETWTTLSTACPDFVVDMSILGIGHASLVVPILSRQLPLVSLHIWSGYDNDIELQLNTTLNHITNSYCHRLRHLHLDFDNYHDAIDDALIRIIACCRKLSSIRIKANANVQVANAICQLVKERANSLNSVDIIFCDMSDPDAEELRNLREEMEPYVEARGINLLLRDNLF